MNLTRRSLLSTLGMGLATGLAACSRKRPQEEAPVEKEEPEAPQEEPVEEPQIDLKEFEDLAIDSGAWQYDETNDCYYQLAVPYCLKPGSEQYESLSVFVPGAYFEGTKHGRAYTCTVAEGAQVGSFTPQTAPVVMPINTSNCSAQESPSSYSYDGLHRYLSAGLVYVYAGFRGRSGGYESTTQEYFSGGTPWPVADLKAAVRCLRYNAGVLPCDTNRIFVFGHGAGGGMGAALGASGDSPLYEPYLTQIGAATHDVEGTQLSDKVFGSASWCPLVSFGAVDAAYEWMMGQYGSDESRAEGTWTKLLSDDLASAYGDYFNALGIVDSDGQAMTLDRIEDGRFAGGTYYDYLTNVIARAAGHFLSHTTFPYTVLPLSESEPVFPGNPSLRLTTQETEAQTDEEAAPTIPGVRQVQATVYDSVESYVATLNGDSRWLTYTATREAADVTGLWGFVQACRPASLPVCAYDAIDRSSLANQLFGTDEQPSLHFDALAARLVEDNRERYAQADGWDEAVIAEWRGDLVETDVLETSVADRVTMTDPLTYLLSEDEEGTAGVAPHWRIHTGLFQSHTPLVSEVNLANLLRACPKVDDVSFEAVWAAGYGLAEREGNAEDNLISWVVSCCPQPEEPAETEPVADETPTEPSDEEALTAEESEAAEATEAAATADADAQS